MPSNYELLEITFTKSIFSGKKIRISDVKSFDELEPPKRRKPSEEGSVSHPRSPVFQSQPGSSKSVYLSQCPDKDNPQSGSSSQVSVYGTPDTSPEIKLVTRIDKDM